MASLISKHHVIRLATLVMVFWAASLSAQPLSSPSARPLQGVGPRQTYSFVFRHNEGVQKLGVLNGLINSALNGGNACYFAFGWSSNTKELHLVPDGGVAQGLLGPMNLNSPTGATELANSQCKIFKHGSSYYSRDPFMDPVDGLIKDRELVLKLNVAFEPGFVGDKAIYSAARDISNTSSGWRARGSWKVDYPNDPSFPKVTLSSGVNTSGPFSIEIADVNTSAAWRIALLINQDLNASNACLAVFLNESDQIWLADNAGTNFSILSLHGNGSVSNSQCTVNASGSTVTRVGNKVKVVINAALTPSFASDRIVYGAGYMNTGTPTSGWRPIGVVGQPDPGVVVSFPSVSGAAKLEANLGPLPIDVYNVGLNCKTSPAACSSNITERHIPACAHNITVRACYQSAFQGYVNQGITGLRFQFAFCGGERSTPLSGCGRNAGSFSPTSTWANNLVLIYADMYAAGIRRITPTSVFHGWGGGTVGGGKGYDVGFLSVCGSVEVQEVHWWPTAPYPLDSNDIPIPKFDNLAYSCAPPNTINFVGWDRIFAVYRFVIERARFNPAGVLEISEFDLSNEMRLNGFNSEGRLIVDNTHQGVDPYNTSNQLMYTPVLETVRKMMSDNLFNPARVTFSVVPEDANLNGHDCGSVYGDSGRILSLSTLIGAIGGVQFGNPQAIDYANTKGLPCGGTLAGAPNLPGPGRPAPGVIDHHHGACLRVENGQCVHYQSQENARLEAQAVFNGVKALMNSYCIGGWRNPSNTANLPLCQPLYTHGEIPLYQPNNPLLYGATCDESSLAGPAGTIAGFNSSQLVNHQVQGGGIGVVFRPWVDPINVVPGATTCYKMPHPLNQYFQVMP